MSGPAFPDPAHTPAVVRAWLGLALATMDHDAEAWDLLAKDVDSDQLVITGVMMADTLCRYLMAFGSLTAQLVGSESVVEIDREANRLLKTKRDIFAAPARGFLADFASALAANT